MKVFRLDEMTGGWFIGNFAPSSFLTSQFEVGYKLHPKGEIWDVHYHKEATEITLLLRGTMIMQGRTMKSGDIFVLEPGEVADPIFVEDCEVIIIKSPSVVGDKYIL